MARGSDEELVLDAPLALLLGDFDAFLDRRGLAAEDLPVAIAGLALVAVGRNRGEGEIADLRRRVTDVPEAVHVLADLLDVRLIEEGLAEQLKAAVSVQR